MNIFSKRPLSLILCILLGGFSLFSFFTIELKIATLSLSVILFVISFFNLPNINKRKILLRISSLTLLIASLLSHLYFYRYYKAYEKFEGEANLTGVISEIEESDYCYFITLEDSKINGERGEYKILAIIDKDSPYSFNLRRDTKVYIKGVIEGFDSEKNDSTTYYLAKGYSGQISELSDFHFIETEGAKFKSKILSYREKIVNYIYEGLGEETGGLLAATLLGEKSLLSPQTKLDFTRIGVSHLLALSGLHLSILALALSKLLSFLGVGKKLRYFVLILFTTAYASLCAFPISVVRAALMLIISNLLFIFAKARDPMTNLLISVTLIVLVLPYSVFDLSLWLSAFATLGVLSFSELSDTRKEKAPMYKKLIFSLMISLFAISATMFLSVFNFTQISLISPITTIIFAFLLEIFLYLGLFFLVCGSFLNIDKPLLFVGNFIKNLAAKFSDINYVSVSTTFIGVKALAVIFTVLFFAFLIFKIKRKMLFVYVYTLSVFLGFGYFSLLDRSTEKIEAFEYKLSEESESVFISTNGESTLIELSTKTAASYENTDYLSEFGFTEIDRYVITDYSKKTPEAISAILSSVKIKTVYLPNPKDDFEREILSEIYDLRSIWRTNFTTYKTDVSEDFGANFTLKYRDSERFLIEIFYKRERTLLLSSGILNKDTKNKALEEILKSKNLIFARNGEKYNSYSFVYEIRNLKSVIFSSNIYLSDYMKNYYEKSGADLYLTPEKVILNVK